MRCRVHRRSQRQGHRRLRAHLRCKRKRCRKGRGRRPGLPRRARLWGLVRRKAHIRRRCHRSGRRCTRPRPLRRRGRLVDRHRHMAHTRRCPRQALRRKVHIPLKDLQLGHLQLVYRPKDPTRSPHRRRLALRPKARSRDHRPAHHRPKACTHSNQCRRLAHRPKACTRQRRLLLRTRDRRLPLRRLGRLDRRLGRPCKRRTAVARRQECQAHARNQRSDALLCTTVRHATRSGVRGAVRKIALAACNDAVHGTHLGRSPPACSTQPAPNTLRCAQQTTGRESSEYHTRQRQLAGNVRHAARRPQRTTTPGTPVRRARLRRSDERAEVHQGMPLRGRRPLLHSTLSTPRRS